MAISSMNNSMSVKKKMAQQFYSGESPEGLEMMTESSRGLDKFRKSVI
jgi:hypothetical protein